MDKIVHEEWLKRNNWVYDPNYADSRLAVPVEKEQDKAQLGPDILKVQEYMAGKINISDICEQYGLTFNRRNK